MQDLSFAPTEYEQRLSAVQRELARWQLDALVSQTSANICYLTGFQTIGSYGYGHYAVIVEPEGDPILFGSDFEMFNALVYAWTECTATYPAMSDPIEALAAVLAAHGLAEKRLGIELGHHSLTASEYRRLREKLPRATFVDASCAVEQVKRVKSPAEIEMMRRAAALTGMGLRAAIEAAGPGRSDNDIAAAASEAMIAGGSEYFSIQPIVTGGRRSGIPHSSFRRTELETGDVILVELVASYERYSAPLMRTIAIGAPSAEVRRAVEACTASVNALIEQIGPGKAGDEIARHAGAVLCAIEPHLVWHGIYGYSVGLTFPPMCSDCPSVEITESSNLTLQPGMVFHCSTSLRDIGRYGTAMSETVLVTERGCEVLTDVPRQLFMR